MARQPLGAALGSINLDWADVATALMGGVAIGRLAWRRIGSPARGGLLGMTAMIGLGLGSVDAAPGAPAGRELLACVDLRRGGSAVRHRVRPA